MVEVSYSWGCRLLVSMVIDTGACARGDASMTGQYTVTYDTTTNKLIIGNLDASATFHIYPTAWLKANATTWNTASFAGGGPIIDAGNLLDAGSVTGFATGTSILSGSVSTSVTAPDVVNTGGRGNKENAKQIRKTSPK